MPGNSTIPPAIDNVIDSSFVKWCTKCLVDAGANMTIAKADAHTAASDAAYFLADHSSTSWTVFAAAAIAAGLLLTFLGYESFYLTFGIVAFTAASVFSFGLLCGASNSLIAAICVGVVAGALAVFICHKFEKIGAALCGAAGGVIAYMYSNGFLLSHLYKALPEAHQTYTPIIACTAMALLGAILVRCYERLIIIATTSLGGAYMIGFGIDRLAFKAANHNLNPLVLISGGGCHSAECYGLFIGIVVLAILGAFLQLRRTHDDKHHEGEPTILVRRFAKARRPSGYEVAEVYCDVEASIITSQNERRVSREMLV